MMYLNIEHPFSDEKVHVDAHITGGGRGCRNSLGVPEEPDDEVEIDIVEVTFVDSGVELSTDEIEEIYDALIKQIHNRNKNDI